MSIWGNILGGTKTTAHGLLVAFGAALTGAATQFGQSGNITDWKPYAGVAIAAAVPAFVGAFSKDPQPPLSEPAQKAATAIEQAGQDYASRKADEVIANLQAQLQ